MRVGYSLAAAATPWTAAYPALSSWRSNGLVSRGHPRAEPLLISSDYIPHEESTQDKLPVGEGKGISTSRLKHLLKARVQRKNPS